MQKLVAGCYIYREDQIKALPGSALSIMSNTSLTFIGDPLIEIDVSWKFTWNINSLIVDLILSIIPRIAWFSKLYTCCSHELEYPGSTQMHVLFLTPENRQQLGKHAGDSCNCPQNYSQSKVRNSRQDLKKWTLSWEVSRTSSGENCWGSGKTYNVGQDYPGLHYIKGCV